MTASTISTRPNRRLDFVLAFVCAFLAFLAYLRTMRPTFGWSDSSELITAAYYLGIGHSPGYPTWLLLMHPFSRIPIGDAAFRVNFATVLIGAVAIGLLYYVYARISKSRPAAMIAALTFAFSATFWDQTTEAEVYTLHVALAALIILLALAWRSTQNNGWLYLLSWVVGISLGNHALTALMIPALFVFVWSERGGRFFTPGRVAACLGLFALGVSIYGYELTRGAANPPPHINNPHNLAEFWSQLTAPGARESMFDQGLLVPLQRAWNNLAILPWRFTFFGSALALAGIASLWRRDRKLAVLLLLIAFFDVAYAMNFSIFDIYIYYLPLHLVWAAFIAGGAAWFIMLLGKQLGRIPATALSPHPAWRYTPIMAVLCIIPVMQFSNTLRHVDGSRDYSPEWFARAVFQQVKPKALILADWYTIAPLGYLKHNEGLRPDVVMYPAPSIHSEGEFLDFSRRSFFEGFEYIYFVETLTYKAGLLREKYWLVPEGPISRLYLDRPDPETILAPIPATPRVRYEDTVGLVKVGVEDAELRPGVSVDFTVYWTPLADYDKRQYQAIYALTKDGDQIWQESALLGYDLYPAEHWKQGDVVTEKHSIYLAEEQPTGEYELTLRVRPRGESERLRHDAAKPGQDDRIMTLGTISVAKPQPPVEAEKRMPKLIAWLRG